MLDFALQYAGRGWRVFPCHSIENGACTCGKECASPGKHPRIKGGFKSASSDPRQIEAWWTKWPEANIAIATGNGLTVLDIDGPKGLEELTQLISEHEPLPVTLTAKTGNGHHAYYADDGPGALGSSAKNNLHIRGNGGYVIASPSKHASGRNYQWTNNISVARLPEWVRKWAGRTETIKQNLLVHLGEKPAYLTGKPIAKRAKVEQSNWSPQEEERIRGALFVLPAEHYDVWVEMGMALHSLDWQRSDGSDIGFDLWDEWSSTSDEKYSPVACSEKWASFKRSGITIASLFHRATVAGWNAVKEVTNGNSANIDVRVSAFLGNSVSHEINGVNGNHAFPEFLAKEKPGDPLILLNDKHAVIADMGGKCLVLCWVPSKVDDSVMVPSFQSFKAFSERYANRYVQVGDEVKQLGAHWLKWTPRTTYEGIDLVPNGPKLLPNQYLNLWSGFAIEPQQGDWTRMQEHIFHILASGESEAAKYIFNFAAWAIQNPGDRAEVALVFRGEKGTGKGTFANALKNIFGQHGLQIWHPKHFIGAFNAHLRNCLLLYADEAFWAGDKQGESILKGMLTEPTLMIEQKGVDATPWKNRLHVIMTANNEWVVPASHDERRYVVMDVSSRELGNKKYFTALHKEITNGGSAAMLYALKHVDLKGWHPRETINTKGLIEQKRRSLQPFHEWWEHMLQTGVVPGRIKRPDGSLGNATTGWLLNNAREYAPRIRDMSAAAFARLLKEQGCTAIHANDGTAWRFPDMVEARQRWETRYRGWNWQEAVEEWRR